MLPAPGTAPAPEGLATRRARAIAGLLLAAVAATAGIALAPGSRAAAVDDGTLGIRPAAEADFFHLELAPGAALDTEAVVTNHGDEPVTLRTYPVDATSDAGGFAMQDEAAPREGVGAWVQLARDTVTVAAGSEVRVPIRVEVPAGTRPGDYAGAVIIQAPPAAGEAAQLGDGTAVRLDVVQRLGVRIYLHVAGEAVTDLVPGAIEWRREGSSIEFSIPITNTGNTNLRPAVELELEGWPGPSQRVTLEGSQELLTGATHVLEGTIEDAPPAFAGSSSVTVRSEAGEHRASTSVVYAEWQLLVAAPIIAGIVALIAWRVVRFVKRARRAIAELERRGEAPEAGLASQRSVVDEPPVA